MPAPFWLRSGFDAPAPRFKREGSGAVFRASSLLQAGGASTLSPRFGGVSRFHRRGAFSLFALCSMPLDRVPIVPFPLASLLLQAGGGTCPFLRLQRPSLRFGGFGRLPVHGVHAVRSGAFWRASAGCLRHASASSPSVRRSTMSRAFRSPASALATRAFASFARTL